jgi:hypothetical protein
MIPGHSVFGGLGFGAVPGGREKGSGAFTIAGLGLCLYIWGWCRDPVVWGTLGDELCLQWCAG